MISTNLMSMASEHVFKVFRVKMSEKMARKMEEQIESGDFVSYADEIRQALSLLLDDSFVKAN